MAKGKPKKRRRSASAPAPRRRFFGRRKRHSPPAPLGVKVGASIAVLAPVGLSGLAGAKSFFDPLPKDTQGTPVQLDLWNRAGFAFWSFLRDYVTGYGASMGNYVQVTDQQGTVHNIDVTRYSIFPGGTAPGTYWYLTLAGVTTAVSSAFASWLARKGAKAKQIKLFGQRIA